MPRRGPPERRARGFTYVGLLLAVALAGAGLALAGQMASTQAQREREAQLLFAGDQYRSAIKSFNSNVPAGARRLPLTLEELLEDRRGPVVRRHLRRLYPDPMTGAPDWLLVRDAQGQIAGVYSRSLAAPLKTGGFAAADADFGGAKTYREWRFVHGMDGAPPPVPAAASSFTQGPLSAAAPEPAPAPPEPVQPSVSQAQLRRDMAERSGEGCQRIFDADMAICARLDERPGRASRSACESSASARQAACAATGSGGLPPLVTRPPERD
jgi:type II secretory pathway pseudopilin PulG